MIPEKVRDQLFQQIAHASTARARDFFLDRYLEASQLASEWDAEMWGFDPARWMLPDRNEMNGRGGSFHPREII